MTKARSNATANAAKGDLTVGNGTNLSGVLAVGNNGETIVADSSTATGLRYQGSMAAGKNAVINGGMDIWQRGTTFTGTSPYYGADRWFFARPAAAAGSTMSRQSSGLTGFNYCARLQRDSGNTNTSAVRLFQSLESADSIPFAGKTVTLSFYVRSGANYSGGASTYIGLYSGTGTDQQLGNTGFTGVVTVALNNTITPTSTWTRYSITGTVGSTATEIGIEMGFVPTGTAGANDYIEVTGVQLEVGSVATLFSRAGGTIQGELAACQRYYQRYKADSVFDDFGYSGKAVSTTEIYGSRIPFVPFRVNPTSVDFANVCYIPSWGAGTTAVSNIVIASYSSADSTLLVFTTTGISTGTIYYILAGNTTNAYIGLSAEL